LGGLVCGLGVYVKGKHLADLMGFRPNNIYLGLFDTPELASDMYQAANVKEIHQLADVYKELIDQGLSGFDEL